MRNRKQKQKICMVLTWAYIVAITKPLSHSSHLPEQLEAYIVALPKPLSHPSHLSAYPLLHAIFANDKLYWSHIWKKQKQFIRNIKLELILIALIWLGLIILQAFYMPALVWPRTTISWYTLSIIVIPSILAGGGVGGGGRGANATPAPRRLAT